jgi:hypothetical protein
MDTISTRHGQNLQREGSGMSSAVIVERAARGLINCEATRAEVSEASAIQRVASSLRVAPGSLGNIVRRRVKSISADMRDRIVAACIADLTREMQRLEHDRQMLMAMGEGPRSDDMDAVESALATARAALDRMKGGAA